MHLFPHMAQHRSLGPQLYADLCTHIFSCLLSGVEARECARVCSSSMHLWTWDTDGCKAVLALCQARLSATATFPSHVKVNPSYLDICIRVGQVYLFHFSSTQPNLTLYFSWFPPMRSMASMHACQGSLPGCKSGSGLHSMALWTLFWMEFVLGRRLMEPGINRLLQMKVLS